MKDVAILPINPKPSCLLEMVLSIITVFIFQHIWNTINVDNYVCYPTSSDV